MIIQITREDGPFVVKEYHYDNMYLRLSQNGELYGHIHLQKQGTAVYLHLYMDRFSVGVVKEMRKDLIEIKLFLRSDGVKIIVGTHELEGCAVWNKFVQLMGFSKPEQVVMPEGVPAMITAMEV